MDLLLKLAALVISLAQVLRECQVPGLRICILAAESGDFCRVEEAA